MPFKLNKNDRRVLTALAEYRLLTISQIAAIQQKSLQVVRRRLSTLEKEGLVVFADGGFGQCRGRPERLVSLSTRGVALVRAESPALRDVLDERIDTEGIRYVNHQLLANWFQIHMDHVVQVIPQLTIRYLAPTSPFVGRDDDNRSLVFEHKTTDDRQGKARGFTPDAVFAITDSTQGKTLLFFLEVDRGTESVASPKRHPRDIRQKLINYQDYFRNSRYKRYEKMWESSLNGFRLLFLANTRARLTALCKMVRDMPPSDFVWLTDQEQMFAAGLSAEIWTRGGRHDTPPQSILGPTLACRAALLPLKS